MILRSPFPRIHYYHNKRLQVKKISVPYTNLQLNPYPNTQLDFQCMAPSAWLTNRYMDPSTWPTINLRRMLAAKFFSSSTRWKSWNSLVTKPYGVHKWQLFQEKNELGHMSLVTICLWKTFVSSCIDLHYLWWPLK